MVLLYHKYVMAIKTVKNPIQRFSHTHTHIPNTAKNNLVIVAEMATINRDLPKFTPRIASGALHGVANPSTGNLNTRIRSSSPPELASGALYGTANPLLAI